MARVSQAFGGSETVPLFAKALVRKNSYSPSPPTVSNLLIFFDLHSLLFAAPCSGSGDLGTAVRRVTLIAGRRLLSRGPASARLTFSRGACARSAFMAAPARLSRLCTSPALHGRSRPTIAGSRWSTRAVRCSG